MMELFMTIKCDYNSQKTQACHIALSHIIDHCQDIFN